VRDDSNEIGVIISFRRALRPESPSTAALTTAARLTAAQITRRSLFTAAAGGGILFLAACTSGPTQPTTPPTPTVPSVTGVTPATGSLTGGTVVTITGKNLGKVAGVTFGTVPGTAVKVVNATTVTVVAPASVNYAAASVAVQALDSAQKPIGSPQQYAFAAITEVDKQMLYAFTYWQNYNLAEWGVFTANDCGNFVNQTLVARGWTQNPDWYSTYATNGGYTLSWVRGTPMFDYLSSRPDVTHYTVDQREKVKVGDVVMFDWDPQDNNGVDHTMVVSQVNKAADGTIGIKCVGHTVDAQFRDLDNAITVEHPGATAHFFVISS
jgi:Putative amidase domain/IPT/TIG domain